MHLAQQTRSKQFAFIRLSARRALSPVKTAWIARVAPDVSAAALVFGSSISEQLWGRPRLPIPSFLWFFAARTEGAFPRLGNAKMLEGIGTALNRSGDVQEGGSHTVEQQQFMKQLIGAIDS
jgi:hypothetical protein